MDIRCFFATAAVFAAAASAAQMKDMVMRVPLMPSAPVVDGVVDAKEWQAASGSFGFVRYRSAGDTIAVYRADILPDGLGVKFGLLAEDAGSAHGRFPGGR